MKNLNICTTISGRCDKCLEPMFKEYEFDNLHKVDEKFIITCPDCKEQMFVDVKVKIDNVD